MYEYYIAHSIIQETQSHIVEPLDEEKTLLNTGYLFDDLDILRLIGEHLMIYPTEH